ncbi:MAG: hypothetical protein HOB52_07480, partial [Euryarchaeota archaeon]|nr:hypothetical protein [Euryarchaeota archaeon]
MGVTRNYVNGHWILPVGCAVVKKGRRACLHFCNQESQTGNQRNNDKLYLLKSIDDGGGKLDKFIENFSHSDSPFTSVLIANRGEIACRIIRACRELGLSSVAVYAENDATSLFVEMADSAILLPGEQLAETYLNAEAIIAAAHASGAGAIHPGFGFLSERADFAQAVTSAGLVWVGPSPHAITSMGDKMT